MYRAYMVLLLLWSLCSLVMWCLGEVWEYLLCWNDLFIGSFVLTCQENMIFRKGGGAGPYHFMSYDLFYIVQLYCNAILDSRQSKNGISLCTLFFPYFRKKSICSPFHLVRVDDWIWCGSLKVNNIFFCKRKVEG